MKAQMKTLSLIILFATASSAQAALLQANSDDANQTAFAGSVSVTDLIHLDAGTVPVGSSDFSTTIGSRSNLTDGVNGAATAAAGIAWDIANNGTTRVDYTLGLGDNGLGYDISLIRTIAAWSAGNFHHQHYNVYISTVDAPGLALLNTGGDIANAPASEGGATMIVLTDSTGLLASGVTTIRFEMLPITTTFPDGATYREFDVEGVSTAIVPTPAALPAGLAMIGLLATRRRRK